MFRRLVFQKRRETISVAGFGEKTVSEACIGGDLLYRREERRFRWLALLRRLFRKACVGGDYR